MAEIIESHDITIVPEANDLLDQNETLKDAALNFILKCVGDHKNELDDKEQDNPGKESFKKIFDKAKNHYQIRNNVYIFNFADLAKLMTDTKATHIMVVEGSQQFEKLGFKMGQSTITIAPCIYSGDSDPQGEIYKTVGNTAKEHPQFRFERTHPFNKDSAEIEVKKVKS